MDGVIKKKSKMDSSLSNDKEFDEHVLHLIKDISEEDFKVFYNYKIKNDVNLFEISKIADVLKMSRNKVCVIVDNYSKLYNKFKYGLKNKSKKVKNETK
jgi:hypothetical protein